VKTRWQQVAGAVGIAALLVAALMTLKHLPAVGNPGELVERIGSGEPLTGTTRWLTLAGLAVGTLVSEDLASISAGLLAGMGRIGYPSATGAAFVGIFVGDLLIYGLGFFFGRPLLRHRWSRFLFSERAVDRAQRLFHRHGIWIILITRFIPGTRSATYFSAGSLHAPFGRFVLVFALAAALWTPLLVGLSYLIGNRLIALYTTYEAWALPFLLAAVLFLYLFIHYGIPAFSPRGRRRLRGKWIRATRWEFWPAWRVNGPVAFYVLWLGIIRYRCPTLFTAVNPCMPHGGFIGESKSELLQLLAAEPEALPRWTSLPADEPVRRLAAVREAMDRLGLRYPVVFKPDEGQRGLGVRIIRSEEQARDWLAASGGKMIIQETIGGREYGIFYVRYPEEAEGQLISLVSKEQSVVTGNGHDTLEDLIHAHPRAIALLDTYLARFAGRLEEVPAPGERVPLGELGTHALGSVFLDARDLITPELTRRVDAIARACPGFYFGRLDVKVPDIDSLRAGRDLKVLEINGLTSEAAHIYDPRHGLVHAWRTLCRQWRTAFEIADRNRRRGVPVTPLRPFLRDSLEALRRQRRESGQLSLAGR
jgi:membrane protein DedA with SNARE-associated domain